MRASRGTFRHGSVKQVSRRPCLDHLQGLMRVLFSAAMTKWWSYFATAQIDFLHTSGGNARGDLAQIKPNEVSYSFMYKLTGKKILADTGYGVGGAKTGHNAAWDDANNLRARHSDGVISVVQSEPRSDWINTIRSLKSTLPKVC